MFEDDGADYVAVDVAVVAAAAVVAVGRPTDLCFLAWLEAQILRPVHSDWT